MKVMDNSYFLLKKEIVIVSKSELLNALFIEWRQKQINEPKESLTKTTLKNAKAIKYNFFCEDGIICEEQFEKEKIKVLFISNESNTENKSNLKNGQSPSPESATVVSPASAKPSGSSAETDTWEETQNVLPSMVMFGGPLPPPVEKRGSWNVFSA